MTDGQDRRRTDSEAARARRREQQRQWEAAHAATRGPEHISEAFARVLGAVLHAARGLPVCDRAAKLQAAITRLVNAPDTATACSAAHALLHASELALREDPWFRFYLAATEAVAVVGGTA